MMRTPPPSNGEQEQLERIVAYLDGELPAAESARVEEQLASDASFRQQLQGMDRAWAALDQLPGATVEDNFSQTTMALVVEAARSEVHEKTQALPVERRNRGLTTVALIAAAVLLGVLVFRLRWENPNRLLLAELPVIQYVDIYSQFRDIEFLRQLHRALGDEAWAPVVVDQELADKVEQFQRVASADDRRQWLEQLAPEEKATLRAKYNRFRALSEDQQWRLRQLHEQIVSSPDAMQLQRTMLQYQQWLHGQPPSRQFELRELSASERARQVARMVEQSAHDQSLELTPQQLRALYRAIRPQMEVMKEKVVDQMSPRERARFDTLDPRAKFRHVARKLMLESSHPNREVYHAVLEALPAEQRKRIEQLPPRQRWSTLRSWLRQAVIQETLHRRPWDVPQQELEAFFAEELSAAAKEELLAMPRERMQQQLKHLYLGGQPPRDRAPATDEPLGPPRRAVPPHAGDGRRRGPPLHPPRRDHREDRPFRPHQPLKGTSVVPKT